MAKINPTATATAGDEPVQAVATATVDLSSVEKRIDGLEKRLNELADKVDALKVSAPVSDNSGLSSALAALEARVSSYIGRGR